MINNAIDPTVIRQLCDRTASVCAAVAHRYQKLDDRFLEEDGVFVLEPLQQFARNLVADAFNAVLHLLDRSQGRGLDGCLGGIWLSGDGRDVRADGC